MKVVAGGVGRELDAIGVLQFAADVRHAQGRVLGTFRDELDAFCVLGWPEGASPAELTRRLQQLETAPDATKVRRFLEAHGYRPERNDRGSRYADHRTPWERLQRR